MVADEPSTDFSLGQAMAGSFGIYQRHLIPFAAVLTIIEILTWSGVIALTLGAFVLLAIQMPTDTQLAFRAGEEVALNGQASAIVVGGCSSP